jgi:hypothetical protein
MLEPTLFAGRDAIVNDRIADLRAIAVEIRPPGRHTAVDNPGVVQRTRGTLGRLLVSLGTSVAGQPQA